MKKISILVLLLIMIFIMCSVSLFVDLLNDKEMRVVWIFIVYNLDWFKIKNNEVK